MTSRSPRPYNWPGCGDFRMRSAAERSTGAKMKYLQIALDMFDTREALKVLEDVGAYVDIIEVGTPMLMAQGSRAVEDIVREWHQKRIFADTKVMDAGRLVPIPVLDAGADAFSVLAAAEDATIEGAVELARERKARVLVDMCAVKDIRKRAAQLQRLDPDILCVHVGYDMQGVEDPIDQLRKLDGMKCLKAIAGGITWDSFEEAAASPANIIICGGGLVHAKDRAKTASRMRAVLDLLNAEERAEQ